MWEGMCVCVWNFAGFFSGGREGCTFARNVILDSGGGGWGRSIGWLDASKYGGERERESLSLSAGDMEKDSLRWQFNGPGATTIFWNSRDGNGIFLDR